MRFIAFATPRSLINQFAIYRTKPDSQTATLANDNRELGGDIPLCAIPPATIPAGAIHIGVTPAGLTKAGATSVNLANII